MMRRSHGQESSRGRHNICRQNRPTGMPSTIGPICSAWGACCMRCVLPVLRFGPRRPLESCAASAKRLRDRSGKSIRISPNGSNESSFNCCRRIPPNEFPPPTRSRKFSRNVSPMFNSPQLSHYPGNGGRPRLGLDRILTDRLEQTACGGGE